MTVKFGFYDSLNGDRLYNANDFNTIFEGVFSDGVFEHVGDALIVEPNPGVMGVLVKTGRAWFNNSWLRNTSILSVLLIPSSLIYDRIDLIVLEFDSNINVRENSIKVITGFPAAIPIPPVLANTSTLHQYALAEVLIPATSSEVLLTNITNKIGSVGTPYSMSLISEPSSAPVTTALNDFQLGDGYGQWIKKTINEVRNIFGYREALTADRTYYVRTDGSDTNTGLANTSVGAFYTIQKAIDVACSLDGGIYNITIQIEDGSYSVTTGVICKTFIGSSITIQGNATTPDNVVLTFPSAQTGFTLNGVQGYIFKNFKIVGTGSNASAINAINGSRFYFSGINYGVGWQRHNRLFNQAICEVIGGYKISGGCLNHWYLYGNASVHLPFSVTATITLIGTPAFSGSFASVNDVSWILQYSPSWTYSGSATGVRYVVSGNGVLNTLGGGTGYLPGNSITPPVSGGQYL
jgi:hypothetical protein